METHEPQEQDNITESLKQQVQLLQQQVKDLQTALDGQQADVEQRERQMAHSYQIALAAKDQTVRQLNEDLSSSGDFCGRQAPTARDCIACVDVCFAQSQYRCCVRFLYIVLLSLWSPHNLLKQ